MNYWLMKSEPDELSIDALKKLGRSPWTGVRGYAARNYMRDQMHVGDLVIFYHSSATPAGPAGIARVASLPYPDFTQFDATSEYYDPKAVKTKPTWIMVDIAFVKRFARTITRDELRAVPALSNMKLWKQSRLSISPLTKKEFDKIVALGENLNQEV